MEENARRRVRGRLPRWRPSRGFAVCSLLWLRLPLAKTSRRAARLRISMNSINASVRNAKLQKCGPTGARIHIQHKNDGFYWPCETDCETLSMREPPKKKRGDGPTTISKGNYVGRRPARSWAGADRICSNLRARGCTCRRACPACRTTPRRPSPSCVAHPRLHDWPVVWRR